MTDSSELDLPFKQLELVNRQFCVLVLSIYSLARYQHPGDARAQVSKLEACYMTYLVLPPPPFTVVLYCGSRIRKSTPFSNAHIFIQITVLANGFAQSSGPSSASVCYRHVILS